MIPQISQAPGVVQLVLNFLQELEQQGFTGDTATSYADRLTMSTDNSIYQLLPDAVVFPRSTADVALIARLAAQERYSSLIFTPAAAAPALTVRRSTRVLLLICPAI
ncbi:putative FAD-binding oxidase [Escherichia coli]|nr:putative FAD-binding oxidase [Escherichia coli]